MIHGNSAIFAREMASAMSEFVAVLEAIPSRKELAVCSTRTKEAKESAKALLELCRKEENMEVLAGSCARLNAEIKSIIGLSCQKRNGPKMAPHSTFSRKKWNGVPVLAAKNSTLLPKMELLFILAS